MTKEELFAQIKKKKSFLCIGLDTDIDKIPRHLLKFEDPIFEFNKRIIEATHKYTVAYKPNLAFYELMGPKGMVSLQRTVAYIEETDTNLFIIADAKRGDIGNTSKMYAKTFFKYYNCDAITVAPYMGEDSISPFLEYKDKWTIILALTSNKGAEDFQWNKSDGMYLFRDVIQTTQKWDNSSVNNTMYVVGATKAQYLKDIRGYAPDHFLLVPGIGAQGGSLAEVAKYGMNDQCGLLVNSSRGIIYAGMNCGMDERAFASHAAAAALEVQQEMGMLLKKKTN